MGGLKLGPSGSSRTSDVDRENKIESQPNRAWAWHEEGEDTLQTFRIRACFENFKIQILTVERGAREGKGAVKVNALALFPNL